VRMVLVTVRVLLAMMVVVALVCGLHEWSVAVGVTEFSRRVHGWLMFWLGGTAGVPIGMLVGLEIARRLDR